MRDVEFESLYARESADLFAFLAYRTGDRVLAQDLMADTFERVLRARGRYDRRKGSLKTWLYAIALNVVRDHARRSAAEGRAFQRLDIPAQAAPDEALDGLADRDALARALAQLADEEREAVALRFGADLTVPQMATVLGERQTTVEGRVYRALRKLRATLEADDSPKPDDRGPEPRPGTRASKA